MGANEKTPVIGLLGGVGAGKSTVAAELAALGCAVVDADAVGHEVLQTPEVGAELRRRWGAAVFGPDGRVDRAALAAKVFDRPESLQALNTLMHPPMRARLAERIERATARAGVRAVVLDAAVLLDAGWDDLCTHRVYVDAPDATRARRAESARGWSRDEWRRREKSQKALDIKRARSEYVLDNSSSLACLREQVRSVFHRIVRSVDRPRQGP